MTIPARGLQEFSLRLWFLFPCYAEGVFAETVSFLGTLVSFWQNQDLFRHRRLVPQGSQNGKGRDLRHRVCDVHGVYQVSLMQRRRAVSKGFAKNRRTLLFGGTMRLFLQEVLCLYLAITGLSALLMIIL